jgi:hypothetical protein
MCSGCSGSYPSDFDDSDDLTVESGGANELEERFCEADAGRRFRGKEGAANFEADATAQLRSETGNWPGRDAEEGVEHCEILVSATRIIEIRIVDAKRRYICSLEGKRASEISARDNRSAGLSAKYYQTLRSAGASPGDCAQAPCYQWVSAPIAKRSSFRRLAELLAKFRAASRR